MPQYQMTGSVGRTPELSFIPSGSALAKFSLSINTGTKEKPKRIWVKCIAWKDNAERVAKHIFQGNLIGVNGKVADVETWIDKDGKTPKAALVFTCFEVGRYDKGIGWVDIRGVPSHERLTGAPQPDDEPF